MGNGHKSSVLSTKLVFVVYIFMLSTKMSIGKSIFEAYFKLMKVSLVFFMYYISKKSIPLSFFFA